MYLIQAVEGKDNVVSDPMITMFADKGHLFLADKVEVWGTEFKDVGPDYTEFRYFRNGEEKPYAIQRVKGY